MIEKEKMAAEVEIFLTMRQSTVVLRATRTTLHEPRAPQKVYDRLLLVPALRVSTANRPR
jgi:hypothetical protein